jgi:hypothetical protein
VFWRCLFFYRRSFILSQRTNVPIMCLHSQLWLTWRNILFIEYGASVASDFDDGDQCFGGNEAYIIASGLHGFPCEEKSTVPKKVNARNKI